MSEKSKKMLDIKPAINIFGTNHSFQSRGPVNIKTLGKGQPKNTIQAVDDPFKHNETSKSNLNSQTSLKTSISDFMTAKIPPFRVERLAEQESSQMKNTLVKLDDGFVIPTVPSKHRIVKISTKPAKTHPKTTLNSQITSNAINNKPVPTILNNSQPIIKAQSKNDTFNISFNQRTEHSANILAHERIRKPCNCTKSQCLKLYCECYSNGMYCLNCNCVGCHNNEKFDEERSHAIQTLLARNPTAFKPKMTFQKEQVIGKKGCSCSRSSCLRNHCECYANGVSCTAFCGCDDCRNSEFKLLRRHSINPLDFPHLNLRAQVLKNDVASSCLMVPSDRIWNASVFNDIFTEAVIDGLKNCLLARIDCCDPELAEEAVLEEFGNCILYVKERFIDENGKN